MARQKKKARRLNPLVFLVVAMLIVIVGVEITKVYWKLHQAQGQEQTLSQQQEQLSEENQALRENLEKKDDKEFIKSLARGLGWYEDGTRLFVDPNR